MNKVESESKIWFARKQGRQSEVDNPKLILHLKCKNVCKLTKFAQSAPPKCAMMVNIKCRTDNICAKSAENKMKQSNLVYILVKREERENLSF